MTDFPLPGAGRPTVAVPAPGSGPQTWSGAPSAVLEDDGTFVLAYRVRVTSRDFAATVVARSTEGERFEPVLTLDRQRFDAFSIERPALVRTGTGRWRLYVSRTVGSWPPSKAWRIDVLEAHDLAGLADAKPRIAFAGDASTAVKDPVIRRTGEGWEAWVCCHPLDEPGEEDRMTTAYATSEDGLDWTWHGAVLRGRAGSWDARGARVTAVLADGRAAYDGRASKEENFAERTGLAVATGGPGALVQSGAAPVSEARYLDVVPLPGGGHRLFYEAPLADGSHELRTELVT